MHDRWLTAALCCLFILLGVNGVRSQPGSPGANGAASDSLTTVPAERPLIRSLLDWMLPGWVRGSLTMKEFIRQQSFQRYREEHGDRNAVDLIYRKAYSLADGDPDVSLLVCLLGTMDHAEFGLRVPLLGFVIKFPLTTESKEEFTLRRSHLPSRLYPDSPPEGDRDKLQHFFGSAFLAYASGSRAYTDAFGNMTEVIEQAYIVGGLDDPRDRRANLQGALFGKALMSCMDVVPSEFLTDSTQNIRQHRHTNRESIHR